MALCHTLADCKAQLKIRQVHLGSSPGTLGKDVQSRIVSKLISPRAWRRSQSQRAPCVSKKYAESYWGHPLRLGCDPRKWLAGCRQGGTGLCPHRFSVTVCNAASATTPHGVWAPKPLSWLSVDWEGTEGFERFWSCVSQ